MGADAERSRRERTMARVRDQKERHRQRGRVYRVSFATAGFATIALGLVLVPLPGPGWLIVAVGLGMLALEFDRAERLLDRILEKLERVTGEASRLPIAAKVGLAITGVAAGIGVLVAGALWDVPLLPV